MSQRLATVLTITNLALLVFLLVRRADKPFANDVVAEIRCRAFRVVDEQGRPRATIDVLPANIFKPTGKAYPETVIFRLIDAKGRPEVKIAASEEGAGLGFVGQSDDTQVKLEAQGGESSLMLLNKDGKRQELKP
jgi:hypothetical protein